MPINKQTRLDLFQREKQQTIYNQQPEIKNSVQRANMRALKHDQISRTLQSGYFAGDYLTNTINTTHFKWIVKLIFLLFIKIVKHINSNMQHNEYQ